jgi:hypothetical protein
MRSFYSKSRSERSLRPERSRVAGDGGFTGWAAKLLATRKERLLISGYGLDRLAALASI